VVIGTGLYSWSPNIVEVAGLAGLDFIRIDHEQAWRQDRTVQELIRAAALSEVVPMLQVDKGDPLVVCKALGVGAGAVLIPNIQSVEEAQQAVNAAKFPNGHGSGSRLYRPYSWSAAWGARAGSAWLEWSDTEPMIGVTIEDVLGLEAVEQIAAVEGVDFIHYSPVGYSISLGLREPTSTHAAVVAGLERTISAAKQAGKHVMLGVGMDFNDIPRYTEMGITMLEVGNDLMVLRNFWTDLTERLPGLLGLTPDPGPTS